MIDSTVPRGCTATFTGAARRSIRHDLQARAQCGRRGNTNKTIISARFPPLLTRHTSLFYQNRKRPWLYESHQELLLSADRWLITAPAVVQAHLHRRAKSGPAAAARVGADGPSYKCSGGLILSYWLCERCKKKKRNAVVQRTFFFFSFVLLPLLWARKQPGAEEDPSTWRGIHWI